MFKCKHIKHSFVSQCVSRVNKKPITDKGQRSDEGQTSAMYLRQQQQLEWNHLCSVSVLSLACSLWW